MSLTERENWYTSIVTLKSLTGSCTIEWAQIPQILLAHELIKFNRVQSYIEGIFISIPDLFLAFCRNHAIGGLCGCSTGLALVSTLSCGSRFTLSAHAAPLLEEWGMGMNRLFPAPSKASISPWALLLISHNYLSMFCGSRGTAD